MLFVLRHVRTEIEQKLWNVDLDGAYLTTSPAQARCKGQPWVASRAVELWRYDRADRARVNPWIVVAADFSIDRAVVQAGPATYAIERLAPLGVLQQLGPATVKDDDVKLLRSVLLSWAARPAEERSI
jgi:hypothetical protein